MGDSIEELFHQALERSDDERETWLERNCRSDPALYRRVRSLIDAHLSNSDSRVGPIPLKLPIEESPSSIGDYRVIGVIGEGGAGAVFDAHHSGTGRRAAIKLMRTGFATGTQRLRFQLEAEILGKLNHHGIAHLYDAGVAEVRFTGNSAEERVGARRPFIAMEFIDGKPISTWADQQNLGIRERVKLLREAACAVEHAHQRGVIHRDLKPANILVTTDGMVKVVDFGIAKLIAGAMAGDAGAVLTITGAATGTPAFMSPEQMLGQSDQVDLTTDVYGLGATLYFLLCGSSPVSATDLLTPGQVVSLVSREIAPLRTRAAQIDADLAAVVHKAIERDPSRRYPTVVDLEADLERWLTGQPTVARPLGPVVRAIRYVMRNKWRSLAIAALFSAAVVASVGAFVVGGSLSRERAALREQQSALAFLNEMLIRTSPEAAGSFGADRKLSDLVQDAERELKQSTLSTRVAASIRLTLARINIGLGRLDAAVANAEDSIAKFEAVEERGLPRVEALETLALAEKEANRLQRVADLRFEAWKWRLEHIGESDPETLRAGVEVTVIETEAGYPHQAKMPDVKESIRKIQLLKQQRGNQWTRDQELALIRTLELGAQFYVILLDRTTEAGSVVDDAIAASQAMNGPDHPATVRLLRIKGIGLLKTGDCAGAEPLLKEVYEKLLTRLGERHPTTLNVAEMLAGIRAALGQPAVALEMHTKLTPLLEEALGPNHFRVVTSKLNKAVDLRLLGRLAEAETAITEALEAGKRVEGPNRYLLRACNRELALLRVDQGRWEDAALVMREKVFENDPIYENYEGYAGEAGEWLLDYVEILEKLGDLKLARIGAGSARISLLKSCGPEAPLSKRAETIWNRMKEQSFD